MRLLAMIGALALLILTPRVWAAPSMEEDKVLARQHFDAGARHYDLSEWEQALVEFKEAYRQMPDPNFLYNIAQCHRKLGHVDDALTFYRTYLRRAPEAVNRGEVERRITELEAEKQARAIQRSEEERVHASSPGVISPGENNEASRPSLSNPPAIEGVSDEQASLTQTPAGSSGQRSVFTRWWFWTAVGAVVVGGVVAGLLLSRGGDTTPFCPDCANSARVRLP